MMSGCCRFFKGHPTVAVTGSYTVAAGSWLLVVRGRIARSSLVELHAPTATSKKRRVEDSKKKPRIGGSRCGLAGTALRAVEVGMRSKIQAPADRVVVVFSIAFRLRAPVRRTGVPPASVNGSRWLVFASPSIPRV